MVERFRIAAYTRISVDTELDKDNTSIENQKAIIGEYCEQSFPGSTVDYFEDRDRSGYSFDQRPGYMKMRGLLMQHQYDILIIKDLSRFARRNGRGLVEFEDLRDAGLRIISISDGIDIPTRDDWFKIQFHFMYNEMPVTESSKKVCAVIANRQKKGEWICSVPYGYVMTNTKRMLFEMDPAAADVVRMIFRLYLDGWGYKRIANYLTAQHIPTPRMCEKMRKEAAGDEYRGRVKDAWSVVTISEILCNDFYIGTLRQHKYKRKKINGKDVELGEDQHIVFEDHHTPIIDYKTFALVQDQLKVRSTSHYRGVKKYENNYSGLLFCGDCGSPMFSRSRPDLASAYICGTYHARGLAGCTTHHIRTDVLDDIVKSYMQRVCTECNDMLSVLNERLEQDASKVQVQTSVAEDLAVQIEQENETLKVLMRQKTRDVLRAGENASIVEATYDDLIKESTNKIKGLENQMLMVVDLRNTFVQAERFTRTVLDILRDIIEKPTLDRKDLCLLVERIVVHTDRVEILFKDDVYQLLQCASGKTEENLASVAVQSAEKRKNRVLDVRVVSNGDPLEIYTDREGEVIFKKYSPIGELAIFAGEYAETLYKTCSLSVIICDRDAVIATAGVPRKEYADKALSDELEKVIESRSLYVWREGMDTIPAIADGSSHTVRCAMPILSEGDIVGCVVSLSGNEKEDKKVPAVDVETKLIQTAAGFLGRQLES